MQKAVDSSSEGEGSPPPAQQALEAELPIDRDAVELPSQAEPVTAVQKAYHPFSISVVAFLIPTSIFGVLARLGLNALTDYRGHSIFPLAWVQATGCLIMGFALGLKEPIVKFYAPLYTGITTGFCGSLTTFSSWQLDVFLSWANSTNAHRDWFRDVIDGLGKLGFTLAISLSALRLGGHLASLVLPFLHTSRPPSRVLRYAAVSTCILVYAATLPTYFFLSPRFRHEATAAILFAFPGTLMRYILATKVTPLFQIFPVGTFLANTLGTALLGTFHILQRLPSPPSHNACSILQGLADGFCGCLSTVSTFAVEVSVLRTRSAWLYVILSWLVCQLLLLVIMGPSWWSGGVKEGVVCAFT